MDKVFDLFDVKMNEALDREEVAYCVALMCQGSMNEKIYSAFKLFDRGNTNQISFHALNKYINCISLIFAQLND